MKIVWHDFVDATRVHVRCGWLVKDEIDQLISYASPANIKNNNYSRNSNSNNKTQYFGSKSENTNAELI